MALVELRHQLQKLTEICSSNSLLDVYANRAQYNSATVTEKLNFVQFAIQFKVVTE